MNIVFTICSNNYLAQAKALGDSLLKHNPDYQFIIGLVDKAHPKIDYQQFNALEIVQVEEIGIINFEEIWKKYNIVELNTSVKPFYFQFLLNKYPSCNNIIYLDPDIYILSNFKPIENDFNNYSILLTPHVTTPLPIDGCWPDEPRVLNFGLYNLGFLGLSNDNASKELLQWWGERTSQYCFDDVSKGLFVDQLWINLAPIFFKNVLVCRHKGYNVGFWNWHERFLKQANGKYYVDEEDLVFFHFSGYDNADPLSLSNTRQNRFSKHDRKDLISIHLEYKKVIDDNNDSFFKQIPCYYIDKRNEYLKTQTEKKSSSFFKSIVSKFGA